MSTSGAYQFLPSVGELIVAAYRRVQVHRSEILTEHLADARNEANLLQVQWANLGPTLWSVDLQTVALVQGQTSYSVPANTVMMLDVYISIPNGDGTNSDRIIWPFSRTEWASVPDKSQQGSPTSFWYDRLISPSFYLWPTPDGSEPTLSYYRFTQTQDANLANGTIPQVPYLALDAWVACLAQRLSIIYPPPKPPEVPYSVQAEKALNVMFSQLNENTPLYISPMTAGYFRAITLVLLGLSALASAVGVIYNAPIT